jgi:hypothetical protein
MNVPLCHKKTDLLNELSKVAFSFGTTDGEQSFEAKRKYEHQQGYKYRHNEIAAFIDQAKEISLDRMIGWIAALKVCRITENKKVNEIRDGKLERDHNRCEG